MKGRFCYAAFFGKPGIEKLPDTLEVKASFLKPVTSSLSARGPFSWTAVAGARGRISYNLLRPTPATVIFSALHILRGGQARL